VIVWVRADGNRLPAGQSTPAIKRARDRGSRAARQRILLGSRLICPNSLLASRSRIRRGQSGRLLPGSACLQEHRASWHPTVGGLHAAAAKAEAMGHRIWRVELFSATGFAAEASAEISVPVVPCRARCNIT